MKILVFGSRNTNVSIQEMDSYLSDYNVTEIISGGASGPDSVAIDWAREKEIYYTVIYPDWAKYGMSAGPIRNEEMVKLCDEGLGFWDGKSPGSKHTIKMFSKYDKPLKIVRK